MYWYFSEFYQVDQCFFQIDQLFTSTKIIDLLLYFFQVYQFFTFLPRRSKSGLWKKRGKLVLLNLLKNVYEKCYVKIDENWWKKHSSTNNLSKKNDSVDWKLIWWKIDKIGLELVKKYASIWEKKMWVRIMYFIYYYFQKAYYKYQVCCIHVSTDNHHHVHNAVFYTITILPIMIYQTCTILWTILIVPT